jgi:hypothetical protein
VGLLGLGSQTLQYVEQRFADLGDVSGAEREHEVSPLGDVPKHPRYGVLLGYVVHLGMPPGLADGVHYELAVHAGLGHLARAVNFGYEDGVGRGERVAELPVERAGARVAVRLEDRPPLVMVERAAASVAASSVGWWA